VVPGFNLPGDTLRDALREALREALRDALDPRARQTRVTEMPSVGA
jgi:hypothetical protein